MTDGDPMPAAVPPTDPGAPASSARYVIGSVVFVLGLLLTVGSGLCSGVLALVFVFDSNTGPEFSGANLFVLPLVFGGPFIVIGSLMWWGGRALRGSKPPPPPPGPSSAAHS